MEVKKYALDIEYFCFYETNDNFLNSNFEASLDGNFGVEDRAIVVFVKDGIISSIGVWLFGFYDSEKNINGKFYQGKLPNNVMLGDRVDSMSSLNLEYDAAEEWFCMSGSYSGVIISGAPGDLGDFPDQRILSIRIS
ncbi:hypothetical protein GJA_5538 [Janthinobacterium agaricidamnosum NBRC 102515 = DSM 9628]|uniref:Uncharacterized protein n=1 Tax=Janthinobacterium agaricidamnosum NBRC 102515 = DSM 9628 TaxID=1349767 RepID=W0VEK4_9BURK|nr:hypothetical protein GJA_5538 [Janthinobacterium agaricidamnosum NBRC 102515 = DSM 9628]